MINTVTLVSPTMQIRMSCGDLTVVRLEGELDMASTELVATAARLVPDDATLVTVDLRHLTFIDCAGVDAFAAFLDLRKVVMSNARGEVDRFIGFLGLDTLFPEPPSAPTGPTHSPTRSCGRSSAQPVAS